MNPNAASTTASVSAALEPPVKSSDGNDDLLRLLARLPLILYRRRREHKWKLEFVGGGSPTLLGITPEDFTSGRVSYDELIGSGDRERVRREIMAVVVAAGPGAFAVEYQIRHADGQWRTVLEQGRAAGGDPGKIVALEGCITDISGPEEAGQTRRCQEQQRLQEQKLRAVNLLAGGIAHDFNNVIAGILGSAELVKMETPLHHPGEEFLQQIFVAGDRAREMVLQIKMFSQRKPAEKSLIQLKPVLEECLQRLRSVIPEKAEITHQIDPGGLPVLADPAQIQQAIMNLCTDAWHSLPERKGHIEVKLQPCEIDGAAASRHPDLHPGPYMHLFIRHNGHGMSPGALERFFEPFANKNSAGRKTGLKLYVVQQIVHEHDGAIIVESAPGEGLTLHVYLPAQT
jgi:signal transduction histidine kinase